MWCSWDGIISSSLTGNSTINLCIFFPLTVSPFFISCCLAYQTETSLLCLPMVYGLVQDELRTSGNLQCSWLSGGWHLSQGNRLFGWVVLEWSKTFNYNEKLCIKESQFLTVSCLCIAESVKDLIRYLRHEDDTRDVRQQLGAGQILQNDLLPIIIQHGQDKALFDACIR